MIHSNHTYALLETLKFRRGQGVCLANNRDDIDAGRQATHKFYVHFPQAINREVSLTFSSTSRLEHTNVLLVE